jgi:hypothetical protein
MPPREWRGPGADARRRAGFPRPSVHLCLGIRPQIVALPADEPLAGARKTRTGRPLVTLQVETDGGLSVSA